ncbi:hypothetical protein [Agromyces sp. LHK192]|uniref:hypothetical protein n=1 Tax=Agromyces sp. LHK192 TaxID=2498704 RepID=UPI000FD91372|nr:hypothetical protein [Agromyces sp. LHK192]
MSETPERTGRLRRSRRRRPPRLPEERAEALKERVYASFTGLAIVLVQLNGAEHLDAARATLTLATGIVAISAAGFVADLVAELTVEQAFPGRARVAQLAGVAGSALASAAVPVVLLALAWLGVFDLEPALRAASIVYLVTLGVIGWLAVRRTRLPWWQQVFALGTLVALGLGVVGLQQLAHGH